MKWILLGDFFFIAFEFVFINVVDIFVSALYKKKYLKKRIVAFTFHFHFSFTFSFFFSVLVLSSCATFWPVTSACITVLHQGPEGSLSLWPFLGFPYRSEITGQGVTETPQQERS